MISPRLRVITDNDYAGDPDGLFQLAHLLLSPSVDVRAVIGSHLQPGEEPPSVPTATRSRSAADEVVLLLGLEGRIRTFDGSNSPLTNRNTPAPSPAAEAIVAEAMSDSDLPLYVTLGGGLTQLASAYLLEHRIADRLTAIWIGGTEYPGIALPPPMAEGKAQTEYNTTIDIAAAQVVFDSPIPLWQVPRDAYRQALVSIAEVEERVRPCGAIGEHLAASLDDVLAGKRYAIPNPGETYVMGDSPLVLLTALQSYFDADPSSSEYVLRPAPMVDDRGRFAQRPDGRPIRVYTRLDVRLMFEDMYAKLRRAAGGAARGT